jgi:hypothetical protein
MPKPARSLSLRLLAVALLGLAAYNALGVVSGAWQYAYLRQLPLDVPAAYLLAGHGVWALAWGALALGLWRRWSWARWGTMAAAVLYLGHGWLNRLVWGNSDYALQTAPWGLGAGLLAVGLTFWLVGRSAPWR